MVELVFSAISAVSALYVVLDTVLIQQGHGTSRLSGNDRPDRRLGSDVLLAMKRQSMIPAVFVIVLATGGLPAAAQSTDADNAAPVEVTPYVSLGSYPSPRVGAAILFPLTQTLSVESEVGYRHDMTAR